MDLTSKERLTPLSAPVPDAPEKQFPISFDQAVAKHGKRR